MSGNENSGRPNPVRSEELQEHFASWSLMTSEERNARGLPPRQKEFAEEYDVSEATLSRWKKNDIYLNMEKKHTAGLLDRERFENIILEQERKALAGSTPAARFICDLAGVRLDNPWDKQTDDESAIEGMTDEELRELLDE